MLRKALPSIVTELPGPESRKVIQRRKDAIPSSIACDTPCVIDRAEGAMVLDLDGNIFMDWVAGIGVMNVGHSSPEIIEAVKEQTERYFHPQINTIHYMEYIELAEKLNELVPGDFKKRTAFFNSGAEAIENAVKIARKYTGKSDIISFSGGFHGRTFMSMALTSGNIYKESFGPMMSGIHRAEFPNEYRTDAGIKKENLVDYYIQKLEGLLIDSVSTKNTAAFILEPIQGEGGFVKPPIEFIVRLRELCDKHKILLIADEVQTGYCRTGRMFATDYWADQNVYADILVSAKSLAAGLPLSAVTAREEIMEKLSAGEIGGTYGGNAIACVSALKAIEIMERDNYADKAMEIGRKSEKYFSKWFEQFKTIGTYRITGAMLSIEFVKDRDSKEPDPQMAKKVMKTCKYNGLILKGAGSYNQIIRILMPLVTEDDQLEAGMKILGDAIACCSAKKSVDSKEDWCLKKLSHSMEMLDNRTARAQSSK